MITERDKEVLQSIISFKDKYQYSPSLREVGQMCCMSKPTAQRHIMKLVEGGYLEVTPRVARSYVIKMLI